MSSVDGGVWVWGIALWTKAAKMQDGKGCKPLGLDGHPPEPTWLRRMRRCWESWQQTTAKILVEQRCPVSPWTLGVVRVQRVWYLALGLGRQPGCLGWPHGLGDEENKGDAAEVLECFKNEENKDESRVRMASTTDKTKFVLLCRANRKHCNLCA